MHPVPQTAEVDLIRIRTIKRKHLEQILEPYNTDLAQDSWQGIEFLAYIQGYDAMLARNLENGHLRAVRVGSYIYSMQNGLSGPDLSAASRNAQDFARSLPQLFLD